PRLQNAMSAARTATCAEPANNSAGASSAPPATCFGRGGRARTRDFRFWRSALYQLSYAPMWVFRSLFRFAVLRVLATARAELLQRQPIWIVALVLFSVIVALLTVGARQRNEHSVCFLCHSTSPERAHGEDRTHDLTLTKGVLYH